MAISANKVTFTSGWDINRVKLVVEQHVGTGVNVITYDDNDEDALYVLECAGRNISMSQVRKMMRKLDTIKYSTTIEVCENG